MADQNLHGNPATRYSPEITRHIFKTVIGGRKTPGLVLMFIPIVTDPSGLMRTKLPAFLKAVYGRIRPDQCPRPDAP
jgi:hypothetical protein